MSRILERLEYSQCQNVYKSHTDKDEVWSAGHVVRMGGKKTHTKYLLENLIQKKIIITDTVVIIKLFRKVKE